MKAGLAVALGLVLLAPAAAQTPKKAAEPAALRQEFEGFIAKFRAALKANDPAAVAGMSKLPFMGDTAIADVAQFRTKVYAVSFGAKQRTCLQRGKAVYDRDGLNNDNYVLFCGEALYVFTKTPQGFLLTDIAAND
ncbi:hypothetical protein [Prosthecomicrobium sp. N25]|uniref:hypothetical protein n=1 Tax=Prosthecomicrobium sp. N25 TaxID=3129254 RepID=UPI003078A145